MDSLDGIDKTIAGSGAGLDDSSTLIGENVGASVLSAGSIFADRYKIISEGKAGGMGVVYKCLDLKLDQEATALKVIHPRLLKSEEALKRFHQEVTISRKLSHDGIVRVHDIGSHGGLEYFSMEWLEGVSLRDIIAERKNKRHPFSLEETYEIIHPLAEALQHAHRYTIHRDIKPENIMLSESGQYHLKLMDFGIAKMMSVSQLATTSMQMGTPYYMAPEQKLDTGHVDKRADIYSVGVILFELLTLENTIGPELPSDLNPKVPKEIDDVFRKAVALRPENRYGDVGELAAALLKIVSAEKGRLSQADEEAILKQKAELAEQKKREAAEAERRKREEEKKEQEKKRLEAEAQQERLRNWESKTIKRSDVNIVDFGKFGKIAGIIASILFIILLFTLEVIRHKEPPPEVDHGVTVQPVEVPPHRTAEDIHKVNKEKKSSADPTIAGPAEIGRDGRFIAYENGTVIDIKTNLMWAAKDNGAYINWYNAKSYCERYRGGGYSDWRMPSQDELAGLFDRRKSHSGASYRDHIHVATKMIDITSIPSWASETRNSDAAFFNFDNGYRGWIAQSTDSFLRTIPVRSVRE